jgi:hypothetical protein
MTAYQVGREWFSDPLPAIAAADEADGKFIKWEGRTGHVMLTPSLEEDIEAWAEAS